MSGSRQAQNSGRPGSGWPKLLSVFLVVALAAQSFPASAASGDDAFQQGLERYNTGGYEQAAVFFREAAAAAPAAGTLHNLGNAEWQSGHAGPAMLAWERAGWLDPFNRNTRANLRYGRKAALLDPPELAWYEICSTWLPVNAWAWIACLSFWLAVALMMLPGIFRWRRADWHQGLAAAGFAVFLVTLPALAGTYTRSKLGIILAKDAPLKLTPTTEAQVLARLPGGEAARLEQERGAYVYIRTGNAAGWIERGQFGLIADNSPADGPRQ
jgi:hypothetical protein